MKIKIKQIIHERFDAPFIGALIVADKCSLNCKNCFHQYIKDQPSIEKDTVEIIEEVRKNPFNTGIILGGLEFSEQPDEMFALVYDAVIRGMDVMVYSGLDEDEFFQKCPAMKIFTGVYFKFGSYKEELSVDDYYMYTVKLATSNQKIIKL